ncbi:MAG TPA: AbrB/MazE/SpoVT family DNA-binding domain-containing protein [Patescibacteria group bacterium]|jgi:AbrB family looped-hinge helix DNA binding protein|nr:AbrB/MazE/SpoVT family DNA-binding domain-containing protein [Patescibacteria group bacterium]
MNFNKNPNHESSIAGIVTVNDKGQVVIPAHVRSSIDLQIGDKLLVMVHPSKYGLTLIKPDSLEASVQKMLEKLSDAKELLK